MCVAALLGLGWLWHMRPTRTKSAQQILKATGVQGGLIVHLGCGDARLTAAFRAKDSYLVHGLDADAAPIAKARQQLQSRGLYGPESVELWSGPGLPYVDNLVNLVVAENLRGIPMDEVLRVLAPNGVAYLKQDGRWSKTVKPRPTELDEWAHDLHEPSNGEKAVCLKRERRVPCGLRNRCRARRRSPHEGQRTKHENRLKKGRL